MKMKSIVLGFLGVVFVAGAAAAQPLNTPFQIYMRVEGDTECHLDLEDMDSCGRSDDRAVSNLSQVQTILANHRFHEPDWATRFNANVEVRISAAEGPYYGQQVGWNMTNPQYSITFMPTVGNIRPVFVGCTDASRTSCTMDYFFLLRKTGATNVHFRYIRLERYLNGIYLRAGESGPSNSHNSVYGSYFYQIGGYWTNIWTTCTEQFDSTWTVQFPCKRGGVGALNISNSDYNSVANNHFVSIRNDNVRDGHLHAIYLSHHSDYNYVARNRFYSITGEAFRIRNSCWYNLIEANVFSKVGDRGGSADPKGDAGYGDWYDETEEERSSCANEFLNNTLDGRFDCITPLPVFTYHNLPDSCPAGVRRLRTAGNVTTTKACSY